MSTKNEYIETDWDKLCKLKQRERMFDTYGPCDICHKNPAGKYWDRCQYCQDELLSISVAFRRRHADDLILKIIDKYKGGDISKQKLETEIIKFEQRHDEEEYARLHTWKKKGKKQ